MNLTINKKIKYSAMIIAAFTLVFVAYSLLFGKLFPYSPVIIGFQKNEMSNIVVYTQNGVELTNFEMIDSLIPPVEKFHELKFLKKPGIFIFKDKESFHQRSLSGTRACAFYNGRIVISPKAIKEAQNRVISLEIYMKHELSHSLLHQHSGIIHASQYPAWLLEGIAVYSANQMGTSFYPSKEATYTYILHGNFMPPKYFKTEKQNNIKLDVKYRFGFIYSEFACIVDYLIRNYGKDKFLAYMKELIMVSNHDEVFKKTYKINFDECIKNFKNSVMQQL